MSKELIKRTQTSNIAFVFLGDTSSTTGGGKIGLTNASAGLNISVRREKTAAFTSYSGSNIGTISTLGTWADPGSGKCNFKEVDATNAPGLYELHFVDAIFDGSDTSRKLVGFIQATGVVPTPFEIALSAVDIQSAAAFMTGVNSLAPPTNWNLDSIDASGRRDVIKIAGTTQTAGDIYGYLTTNLGLLGASLSAIPKTGFKLASDGLAAITAWTVAITGNITGTVSTVTNLTNAPTSGDFTSTMKTSLNSSTPAVTVSDKTGFSLSSAGIQDIWDKATSALTTAGSIGKAIVDNFTTLLSRISGNVMLAASFVSPDNANIAAAAASAASADSKATSIKAKTDNLPASPAAVGSTMVIDLSTVLSVSPTAGTVGHALAAALSSAVGKVLYTPPASNPGTGSIQLYAKDGTTALGSPQVVTTDSDGNIVSRV